MVALGGGSLPGQTVECVAPVALTGVVSTEGGAPLPDASVSIPALQRRLLTDADGRFVLESICPGSYRVRITHLGYASQDREYRVEAGATLHVSLRSQAVELEGMLVEVAPVMIRLEARRVAHGGRSAAYDWRRFAERGPPGNIPEWVAQRAGVQVVACGDAFWGTRNCFVGRNGVRRVAVCVDESEAVAGPTVLARFPREEIGRAEFYRREGLMKIYTKEFLARAALSPWMIRSNAVAC